MKRISSFAAVQTILSTMPGYKEIKIADCDRHLWSCGADWESENSSFGLVYTVDEILHSYENVRIARAQVLYTTVNEGMLLLVVDTKNEEY